MIFFFFFFAFRSFLICDEVYMYIIRDRYSKFFFFHRPRREKSPLDESTNDSIDDHEEEFYYTEVELGAASSPPTLSHRDMARPPHEGKGCAPNTMIIIRTNHN